MGLYDEVGSLNSTFEFLSSLTLKKALFGLISSHNHSDFFFLEYSCWFDPFATSVLIDRSSLNQAEHGPVLLKSL